MNIISVERLKSSQDTIPALYRLEYWLDALIKSNRIDLLAGKTMCWNVPHTDYFDVVRYQQKIKDDLSNAGYVVNLVIPENGHIVLFLSVPIEDTQETNPS